MTRIAAEIGCREDWQRAWLGTMGTVRAGATGDGGVIQDPTPIDSVSGREAGAGLPKTAFPW